MLENPIQSVPATEVAGKTLVEEFMAMSYEFRRNVLSDKYEMREVCNGSEADANPKPWRTVTRESQNTLLRRAKRELGDLKGLKAFFSRRCTMIRSILPRAQPTSLSLSRRLLEMNYLQTLHHSIPTAVSTDYQPLPRVECLF